MNQPTRSSRRKFLTRAAAGAGTLLLAGCDQLSSTPWFVNLLGKVEKVTKPAQRLFAGNDSLAPEYTKADIAPVFRANGTLRPATQSYSEHMTNGFRDWRIEIGGLVSYPQSLSIDDLKQKVVRTQITRHDCVEGWSCIGEWTGAPLWSVLAAAEPKPDARYVVFHCADPMGADDLTAPTDFYYESLDLVDAVHPQTILAYELNGVPLPVANGAPVRLRVERQLGYKMAKYVERIELVENFSSIRGGKGGYWEDQGYAWYAGI